MPEPIEQRIVDNILGVLRTTETNGVEEGQPPVDPRTKDLPWTWVMVEPEEERPFGSNHTEVVLGVSVLTIYETAHEHEAHRIARLIAAEHKAALLDDWRRGLTSPHTVLQPYVRGASGDGLWGIEVPATITFHHVYGDPYTEGS